MAIWEKEFHRYWTDEGSALLGKPPDKEVRELIGREPAFVALKRQTLGIPPADNPDCHRWSQAGIEILRRQPDAQVADLLGLSLVGVSAARWRYGIS